MKGSAISYAIVKILSDGFCVFLASIAAYFWRLHFYEFQLGIYSIEFFPAPDTIYPINEFIGFAVVFSVFMVFVLAAHGNYETKQKSNFSVEITKVFWGYTAGMSLVLVYFFFAQFDFFSRLIFGLAWSLGIVFVFLGRAILRRLQKLLNQFGYGQVRVLALGNHDQITKDIIGKLIKDPSYSFTGWLSSDLEHNNDIPKPPIGPINDLRLILKKYDVDEVWLISPHAEKLNHEIAKITHSHHKILRLFPDSAALDLAGLELDTFHQLPIVTLKNHNLGDWGLITKSVFDVIMATLCIFALSPLMILIALLIKRQDPKAPVIYRSKRVGLNGVHFDCFKFRTMVPNADTLKAGLMSKNERGDILFKIENDPRITPVGDFLRKTSLDEFPQLFNILKRDMSFIGPRPHLVEEVEQYPEELKQVLSIRPGMSGFAQVNGRSKLSFEEEMRYELFYLKNWSWWLDLSIFWRSILVVLKRDNC